MLPSSHVVPINATSADCLPSPQLLADAFSEFIAASSQLEASYRDLQLEVARLGSELSERNAALSQSLAENSRMRAALQQMLDSLPCGVLVLDHADRVAMLNPEGRTLLQLNDRFQGSLADLSNTTGIDFIALAAHMPEDAEQELQLSHSSGRRWIALRHRDLLGGTDAHASNAKGVRLKSLWILRDVTATKQAELEREASRRTAVLAEISTILAHEIRNPLASLELFAGLIDEDRSSTSQWISHLRAGIRTLSGTVNNVLSLNHQGNLRLSPVKVSACVRSGVEFVQPIAQQAGVLLDFDDAADELMIQGNEDAIRQIILNLTCNAIRHTQAGGSIQVTLRSEVRDGVTCALVEVADSGCGIPEATLARLFEAGFSGTGETPGLGLAVCRQLMEQHGGTIRVQSKVDEGSTFQLEFSCR